LAYCDNFGSMLQAYATVRKINEYGYDCEIIRYKKQRSFLEILSALYYLFKIGDMSDQKRLLAMIINKKRYKEYGMNMEVRHHAYDRFGRKYLQPLFKEYVGYDSLKDGAFNYNLVLVGSDQLWTPMSLYSGFYNLLFVDDSIPKVAYASSFGVSEIPDFQKEQTGAYLKRFNKIGVREQSGKIIVESLSNNTAEVVADPSMLLTRTEWEEMANSSRVDLKDPYILCYFLGKNMKAREAAKDLKRKSGIVIVGLCHNDEYVPEDDSLADKTLYDIDPCDFIHLVKNAAFVCTDSFHCSVFSILFHKKFMTFYRYAQSMKGNRNTRIDSLLGILGLTERLYDGNIEKIYKSISYDLVDVKLSEFRKLSLNFLQDCLRCSK